jgi:hypothetical protein
VLRVLEARKSLTVGPTTVLLYSLLVASYSWLGVLRGCFVGGSMREAVGRGERFEDIRLSERDGRGGGRG